LPKIAHLLERRVAGSAGGIEDGERERESDAVSSHSGNMRGEGITELSTDLESSRLL